MRKLIFTSVLLTITIFGYLFAMIISLVFYTSHLIEQQTKMQQRLAYAALPTMQGSFSAEITISDGRTEAVRQFFTRYDSPLESYAEDIVQAADQYGLDFKLLPAIAMQESIACKRIPADSYNCWGYGIYGGKIMKFNDFKEGIYTVSKNLGIRYKEQGLVTPAQIEELYNPPSEGSWANGVNHFMDQLE